MLGDIIRSMHTSANQLKLTENYRRKKGVKANS